MRILIAGLLGGVAMFAWAFVGHDLLPLGSYGLKTIPNEEAVTSAMYASIGDADGLYVFPAAAMSGRKVDGPQGLVVYSSKPLVMTPATLSEEAGSEIIQALVLAVVLASVAGSFAQRIGLAALIGVAAAMTTSASYWIWYRFPTDYTLGYMFVDWLRYVVAGAVIALLLRPKPASA
jgi:hypothetical protein